LRLIMAKVRTKNVDNEALEDKRSESDIDNNVGDPDVEPDVAEVARVYSAERKENKNPPERKENKNPPLPDVFTTPINPTDYTHNLYQTVMRVYASSIRKVAVPRIDIIDIPTPVVTQTRGDYIQEEITKTQSKFDKYVNELSLNLLGLVRTQYELQVGNTRLAIARGIEKKQNDVMVTKKRKQVDEKMKEFLRKKEQSEKRAKKKKIEDQDQARNCLSQIQHELSMYVASSQMGGMSLAQQP